MFIAPWLFAFLAFTALPILGSAFLAFTNYNVLSPNLSWVGLDNFATILQDQRYWRAVRATLQYALLAVPLKLVFALALAMLLNNARRGVYAYRAAYYAPSIVGASVAIAVSGARCSASRDPSTLCSVRWACRLLRGWAIQRPPSGQ